MPGVFISYRREDTGGEAGRLFDWLCRQFGKDEVFRDVSGDIEPGLEFDRVIEKAVTSCDVLIVLIGKKWLTVADEKGDRRLDKPNDFVRMEVAAALKRDIRVIPVLVQGTAMPNEDQLPEDLKRLSKRQASEISDSRWEYDTGQLLKVLEKAGMKANQQVAQKSGWKAIVSLAISILMGISFSEASADQDSTIGGLILSLVALGLGIAAYYDAKLNPTAKGVKSRTFAIVGMTLAGFVSVAYLGKLMSPEQQALSSTDKPLSAGPTSSVSLATDQARLADLRENSVQAASAAVSATVEPIAIPATPAVKEHQKLVSATDAKTYPEKPLAPALVSPPSGTTPPVSKHQGAKANETEPTPTPASKPEAAPHSSENKSVAQEKVKNNTPQPAATQEKPKSPQELCADRPNFISRGICETRACKTPEWSSHPFCNKLRENEAMKN